MSTETRILPLGLADIMERCNLTRATVDNLKHAGKLPPEDGKVGGKSVWWPETVRAWAEASGRRWTE